MINRTYEATIMDGRVVPGSYRQVVTRVGNKEVR
jgi:hypothetical protein